MVLISNYADTFSTGNLGRLFLNTAYVGIVSTILSLIITILTRRSRLPGWNSRKERAVLARCWQR